MNMDSRQIICIVVTIAIIFENANAGNESNTEAFMHALDNIVLSEKRVYKYARGIYLLSNQDLKLLCEKDMEKAGFIGTSREALKLAFYNHNYTNAKSPKDFCNGIEPDASQMAGQIIKHLVFTSSLQHHQSHAQQHEQPTVDLNLQPSMFTPPIYPDEYPSSSRNRAETSTFYVGSDKSLGFDLNELPPKYQNEHLVLNSSQQYHQPHAQQNEQPTFDLNLKTFVFTPPVYPSGYPFFDRNQSETYKSYVDSDKCLGFDLNELPPAELEEDEKVEGNV